MSSKGVLIALSVIVALHVVLSFDSSNLIKSKKLVRRSPSPRNGTIPFLYQYERHRAGLVARRFQLSLISGYPLLIINIPYSLVHKIDKRVVRILNQLLMKFRSKRLKIIGVLTEDFPDRGKNMKMDHLTIMNWIRVNRIGFSILNKIVVTGQYPTPIWIFLKSLLRDKTTVRYYVFSIISKMEEPIAMYYDEKNILNGKIEKLLSNMFKKEAIKKH